MRCPKFWCASHFESFMRISWGPLSEHCDSDNETVDRKHVLNVAQAVRPSANAFCFDFKMHAVATHWRNEHLACMSCLTTKNRSGFRVRQ